MKINNPADVLNLSKEELVELYSQTCDYLEEIDNQRKAIKDLLAEKIEGNGEVIGKFTVSKAKRINFTVKLDEARDLGAVKEAVDTTALRNLYKKGVEVPHTLTEYIIIKEIIDGKTKNIMACSWNQN